MKRYILMLLVCGLVAAAGTASASYLPGARTGLDPFQLNLWETMDNSPTGVPTETPPAILLPEQVVTGFVVLMEDISTDPRDYHNWSDVLNFFEQDQQWWVQLTSDQESFGFDPFLVDQVLASPFATIQETDPPTLWRPGLPFPDDNEYFIWSDSPVEAPIPEPASVLLLATGLAGLAVAARRRRA